MNIDAPRLLLLIGCCLLAAVMPGCSNGSSQFAQTPQQNQASSTTTTPTADDGANTTPQSEQTTTATSSDTNETSSTNSDGTLPKIPVIPTPQRVEQPENAPESKEVAKPSSSAPNKTISPKAESKPEPIKPETSETPIANASPSAPSNPVGSSIAQTPAQRLEEQIWNFEIPQPWLKDVRPNWDTNKPWKEARIEIRRLLGKNDEKSRREGIRLTWDYLQKNDMGDEHEYGMYMFLGGEPLWAVVAFRRQIKKKYEKYPPLFAVRSLASLYTDYELYQEAIDVLKLGQTMRFPDQRWKEVRAAELLDSMGDVYARWGKFDDAKQNYREAVRLYPLGKPPYGRHLLPRNAKKVQTKLDLLTASSLNDARLRTGRYKEKALGYSGDINLTVNVSSGRITSINVQHQEKIEQNACKLIPQRIVAKQSLQVDGVSGATVTKDAIVAGTLRALKKAGLK